jgi:hypothetical protein
MKIAHPLVTQLIASCESRNRAIVNHAATHRTLRRIDLFKRGSSNPAEACESGLHGGKFVSCLWKNCRKDVALRCEFYKLLATKVVLSSIGRSCHGVTGHDARSTVLLRRTFCIGCREQDSFLLLRRRAPCVNHVFWFFWRMYPWPRRKLEQPRRR